MVHLCRICLEFLSEGHEYFSLNTVVLNTGYTPYREKLFACIPEMSLDAVKDAIICVPCAASLESAYEFRNKCLESEVRIQSFMQEKAPGVSRIQFDESFLQYLGFNFVMDEDESELVGREIKVEDEETITGDEIDTTEDEIVLSNDTRESVEIDNEAIYVEDCEDNDTVVQLIECVTCLKKFTSLMQFNVHQLSEHSTTTNLHTCSFCRRPFNSNLSLERHMNNAHKEYTCMVCEEEYDSKVKYNRHLRAQHGISVNGFPVKSPKFTGLPGIKHKRENLPKQAKKIMYKWLLENCQHPYPTDSQKKDLVEQTNLTLLQVTNWFINARRRILQPLLEKCGGLIDVDAELPDD